MQKHSGSTALPNFKERVRNGIREFSENYTQDSLDFYISRVKFAIPFPLAANLRSQPRKKEEAIKPHDRLVLVG